jgi:hypothetical protein
MDIAVLERSVGEKTWNATHEVTPDKKNGDTQALPDKKKISKFGQMNGVYKGLIIEYPDTWT